MVICERQVHHWTNLDLAVNRDCAVEDGVETDDGGLRWVDDWCRHEGTEDTAVADGEGSASKVLDGELVVASLEREKLAGFNNRKALSNPDRYR